MKLSISFMMSMFALFSIRLALQQTYEVDPERANEWLNEAKNHFNPAEWKFSDDIDSLEEFKGIVESNLENYVMFYNPDDSSTYSTSPFFKTSCEILLESKSKLRNITVNLKEHREIAGYYGIPPSNTLIAYFYHGAPIMFKFDHLQKTKRPVDVWISNVQEKAKNVRKIQHEDDMDIFENSNHVIFLITDEGQESYGQLFSALSYNYQELQLGWMVRNESTAALEKQINERHGFSTITGGIFLNYSGLLSN